MSTWVKENCLSLFQIICIKIIKTGRVPKHIAFIMDGNRRYAEKNSVECNAGHSKGFVKLSECLKWSLLLGIPELTVYAFSIENFKRSKPEVDALMELAKEKFQRILDELDEMNKWGVRIHITGRLCLCPHDLQVLISKAMLATKHNSKLRLNIAYAYTGRDEISRAASHIVDGLKRKEITSDDVDEHLISKILDLGEPDLLIRTSGEVRLSDFMLWQISNSVLYFTNIFWPEFSIWNLLAAIIHFQRHAPSTVVEKEYSVMTQRFLRSLEDTKWKELEKNVAKKCKDKSC